MFLKISLITGSRPPRFDWIVSGNRPFCTFQQALPEREKEGVVSRGGGMGWWRWRWWDGGRSEDAFLRPTSGCSVPLQPLRLRDEADDSHEEKRKIKESGRECRSTCSPGSFLHSGRGRLSHHREKRHRQTHLFNSYKSCVCVCVWECLCAFVCTSVCTGLCVCV